MGGGGRGEQAEKKKKRKNRCNIRHIQTSHCRRDSNVTHRGRGVVCVLHSLWTWFLQCFRLSRAGTLIEGSRWSGATFFTNACHFPPSPSPPPDRADLIWLLRGERERERQKKKKKRTVLGVYGDTATRSVFHHQCTVAGWSALGLDPPFGRRWEQFVRMCALECDDHALSTSFHGAEGRQRLCRLQGIVITRGQVWCR